MRADGVTECERKRHAAHVPAGALAGAFVPLAGLAAAKEA